MRGAAAYSTPTSPAFCHMASLMAGSWSIRVYANQSRPHRQSSPSPDEGEAIRGNQRQSEAIRARALRSAQRQKAIRGNQRQLEAIRGHKRRLEAIRGTPRHSKAISGRCKSASTFGQRAGAE